MILVKTDENGVITSKVDIQDDLGSLYGALGFIEIPFDSRDATHYINGACKVQPHKPDTFYDWDVSIFAWVINLVSAKEQAKAGVTTARNNEERNGFMAYGKLFDSDTTAIQRISVAAQAAQSIGAAFTIEWTCADNSVITLDYDQMINLPLIMAQAANTLHIKARDLKAQIELANSIEELNLITW